MQTRIDLTDLSCIRAYRFGAHFGASEFVAMKQDLLTFNFNARTEDAGNMLGQVVHKLNSQPWMGHEPRTCRVVKLHIKGKAGGQATGYIVIRHRPHGWKIRRINQDEQGRPLDVDLAPLPAGEEPIVVEHDVYEEVDFNQFNFGKLVA